MSDTWPSTRGRRPIDWAAVRAGAMVAIAICLPVALAANILIDEPDESTLATTVSFVAVLAGFSVGGWVAARRSADTPYSSAGVSGLVAFAAIEAVAIVSLALRDEPINVVVIVANAFFAYGAAMLGAALVARTRT